MIEGLSNVRRSKLVRRQKELPPPWRAQKRSAYSPSDVAFAMVPSARTHYSCIKLCESMAPDRLTLKAFTLPLVDENPYS
jgi:hypothetical protein